MLHLNGMGLEHLEVRGANLAMPPNNEHSLSKLVRDGNVQKEEGTRTIDAT